MLRLRLIDAVIVGAVALLALKAVELLMGTPGEVRTALVTRSAAPAQQGPPDFAGVLANARDTGVTPDVDVTGATPDKPAEKPPAAGQRASGQGASGQGASGQGASGQGTSGQGASGQAAAAFGAAPAAPSPAERILLERLGERREELQNRARDVEMREKLIENAEKKLESRLNELKAIEARQQETGSKSGNTTEAAFRNLVTMYETMNPKDAARVFNRLNHDVLVPVVLQMNPRKMAEVLAVMTPEAAEKLTVALAMRAKGLSVQAQAGPAAALPANELPAIPQTPAR